MPHPPAGRAVAILQHTGFYSSGALYRGLGMRKIALIAVAIIVAFFAIRFVQFLNWQATNPWVRKVEHRSVWSKLRHTFGLSGGKADAEETAFFKAGIEGEIYVYLSYTADESAMALIYRPPSYCKNSNRTPLVQIVRADNPKQDPFILKPPVDISEDALAKRFYVLTPRPGGGDCYLIANRQDIEKYRIHEFGILNQAYRFRLGEVTVKRVLDGGETTDEVGVRSQKATVEYAVNPTAEFAELFPDLAGQTLVADCTRTFDRVAAKWVFATCIN